MKYKKLSLVLVVSLVLLLVASLVLVCAWGYSYFYGKDQGRNTPIPTLVADSGRDSLQRLYSATIDHLNTPLDSAWNRPDDSLRNDAQLAEFHRLKTEISELLKKNGSSTDLDSARQKIALLQQRIEELRSRTQLVESENKRLTEIVNRLSSQLRPDAPTRMSSTTSSKSFSPPADAWSETSFTSGFVVNDLRLSAAADAGDESELTGSFALRNSAGKTDAEEVYIVVVQPDGRVLQSSTWETGAFESREGRKVYSTRIRFDYNRGETKKLNFTLHPESLQKGSYVLQVYHHGVLIGRTAQPLL
jgi:hypothetical protein